MSSFISFHIFIQALAAESAPCCGSLALFLLTAVNSCFCNLLHPPLVFTGSQFQACGTLSHRVFRRRSCHHVRGVFLFAFGAHCRFTPQFREEKKNKLNRINSKKKKKYSERRLNSSGVSRLGALDEILSAAQSGKTLRAF